MNFKNKAAILEHDQCGCYFCIEVFETKDITEWADGGETALCPKCGIDSLLPNETDIGYLGYLCEKWFTGIASIEEIEV